MVDFCLRFYIIIVGGVVVILFVDRVLRLGILRVGNFFRYYVIVVWEVWVVLLWNLNIGC